MIITMQQGSPEWHDLRRRSIGASYAGAIMGCNPWKSAADVYDEMVEGKTIALNDAMKRGMDLEEFARRWCEEKLEVALFPVVMRHAFIGFMHASFDGLSMDESVAVEIKCPGKNTHEIAKNGKIPDHYKYQMFHAMEVGNLDFMYYCSYMSDDDAVLIRLDRDDVLIENYLFKMKYFWNDHVCAGIRPVSKKDKLVIDDTYGERYDRLKANLDLRCYLKQHITEFENLVKELEENIYKDCQGHSIECGPFKVTKFVVKGTVDYASIPALNGVDLEPYRKPSRDQWRISS